MSFLDGESNTTMSLGALEEFTAEERALIPQFNPADEPQATATDDAAHGVDQSAQQSTQQPPAEQQKDASAQAPTAPVQTEQPPTEDSATRRALRAARRGEAQALQQAERLKEELEALRKQVPAGQSDSDAIDDAEIEAISADVPMVAKLARKLRALEQAIPAARQAAAPAQPEFKPAILPVEVQDNVDANPTLLAWQHDPDQSRFQAAVAMDAYLAAQPTWANRPMSERFAEVARRVAADHGVAPATQPDPRAAIRSAPVARPNTLSDVPGSGGRQPITSTLERFVAAKSDDEILATLDRMG